MSVYFVFIYELDGFGGWWETNAWFDFDFVSVIVVYLDGSGANAFTWLIEHWANYSGVPFVYLFVGCLVEFAWIVAAIPFFLLLECVV
jgi:hypothetical protein